MLILMTAALVAAQPAPATPQQGQMAPMRHEQHEGMKKDCCKDCCKDMAEHAKHGQTMEHQGHKQ